MQEPISRRGWLRRAGLTLAAAAGGVSAQQRPRPNVLLISIDDLNDWIGALGGHRRA